VKLRQIFVNTKQEADDVHLALSAGADFAKLAALKSSDENLKKNSGDLGYVMKGTLISEIEKEVFSMKLGEFTKPIQTGAGFSILKIEDLKPSEPANFESIKENIKQAMLTQIITQKLPELIGELRQKAKIEINK
jgi:parvulin-like peptidyl-prolyl isomerase